MGAAMQTTPKEQARIGVDIGGTFTDIVLQQADGRLYLSKVPTQSENLGKAVVDGLLALLDQVGLPPAAVKEIVHGTTVGSNAILQKRGSKTGLLTTVGFRDVLEIGRIRTPKMFDLTWSKPEPLVPRRWRLEVDERMAADGSVVRPLDRDTVIAACNRLVDDGVEAVALCFLNSYVNPTHEREAKDLIERTFPKLALTISYDVLPEMKEYERTSTTVVNAYLLKEMRTYLAGLKQQLVDAGFSAPVQVMSSAGGIIGVQMASQKPVFVVGSGPAGGVIGAARLSQEAELRDAVVFDMGGTTAKASVVIDGAPMLTSEYEFRDGISSPSRFVKGGGYVLKVPAIDVAEVGAGGGSIAWVDSGGLLQVGPQSAGADPGPAAYGQGNDEPTVTDANVHLGLLNPLALAGGSKPIFREKATESINRKIAEPFNMSVDEAAHGLRHIANLNMARAIRSVTIECGRDPRDFVLVAFGGSGPLHAADLAKLLGIRRVVVPILSGVFCSVGMLTSDVEHNFVRSLASVLDDCEAVRFDAVISDLRKESGATLKAEGYDAGELTFRFSADLRYIGQSSDLTVVFDAVPFGAKLRDQLRGRFLEAYKSAFGYIEDGPVELVNLRAAVSAGRPNRLQFEGAGDRVVEKSDDASSRMVSFDRGGGFVETPVISRASVGPEMRHGPLIVEAYDTTIVVPPKATVHMDRCGNLLLDLAEEKGNA
jgi:N-methylhydantoinase A